MEFSIVFFFFLRRFVISFFLHRFARSVHIHLEVTARFEFCVLLIIPNQIYSPAIAILVYPCLPFKYRMSHKPSHSRTDYPRFRKGRYVSSTGELINLYAKNRVSFKITLSNTHLQMQDRDVGIGRVPDSRPLTYLSWPLRGICSPDQLSGSAIRTNDRECLVNSTLCELYPV